MVEIGIVVGTLVALALGVSFWNVFAADVVLATGFWLVVAGLAFGLPTGAVYHIALRNALVRAGCLPRRWWLKPISHHRLVPYEDKPWVLAWCRAGAFGCGVVFVGCGVIALGAWRAAGS
jgi:hypothetical protein